MYQVQRGGLGKQLDDEIHYHDTMILRYYGTVFIIVMTMVLPPYDTVKDKKAHHFSVISQEYTYRATESNAARTPIGPFHGI